MLKLNALHTGAAVSEVASASLALTRRDPRLRADTEQTREVSDLDSVTAERWRSFWMKNPLTHLTDKPQSLFRLAGERLEPQFEVPGESVSAFGTLVSEVIEWRIQAYLREHRAEAITSSSGDVVRAYGSPPESGPPLANASGVLLPSCQRPVGSAQTSEVRGRCQA